MIELTQRSDIDPLCPHCTQTLKNVLYREIRTFWGRRYLYFCSACHKALGVTHRKGFFMG